MTAPALVIPTLPPGVPTWSFDTLQIHGSYTLDEHGREWGVSKETGWIVPAALRAQRDDRPTGHGSYEGPAWAGGHTFSLEGYVGCRDPAAREQAELELAGLCRDSHRFYEFRRRTDTVDQVRTVKLDGQPLIEMVNLYTVQWQFSFFASDPRKHDMAWQNPLSSPPYGGQFGLDFSGAGLDFSGAGLDFGNPAQPETAKVGNYGSAPAHPVFTLTGPLTQPVIRHLESGRELSYDGDVAGGEIVWINCDSFEQRGLLGHARVSSTRGNVGALLPIRVGWPVVDPGTAASFQLLALGGPGASMRTALRSAWW